MDARSAARLLAFGRVAIGAAFVAAPRTSARGWIGRTAQRDEAAVLTRGLGVRDVVLGGIALHTLDHPQVGPRWVATCAVADAVDFAAALAAGRSLPRAGRLGTLVLAGGAAVAGLALSAALRGQSIQPE